ncbi:MAG: glycosyltransferase family 25 protein [Candidatus Omnitrophota bacterium]
MSFGHVFDGYCVIHSPHVTGNRRRHFEAELSRVDVRNYAVMEAPTIDDQDSRLLQYHRKKKLHAKRMLSLSEAHIKCVELAEINGFENVVIMEDDIVFRNEFYAWWQEVEGEITQIDWDVLFLYRWGTKLLTEPTGRVTLIPITHNICMHCFVVRENIYLVYKAAIHNTIQKGHAVDSVTTLDFLRQNNVRFFATTRNLAGQAGGFSSSVFEISRVSSMEDMFRIKDPRIIYRWLGWINKVIRKVIRCVAALGGKAD